MTEAQRELVEWGLQAGWAITAVGDATGVRFYADTSGGAGVLLVSRAGMEVLVAFDGVGTPGRVLLQVEGEIEAGRVTEVIARWRERARAHAETP